MSVFLSIYKRLKFIANNLHCKLIRFTRIPTTSQRGLPDFMVIGVQKGGTTSLFSYLKSHPQLNLSLIKEVHYFDTYYHKGIKWYKRFFPITQPGILTGEASPDYFYHPHAPARIKKDIPNTKFILLLRNPVSRAFSNYNMVNSRKYFKDPVKTFEEAIEVEPNRINQEEEKMLQNPNYFSFAHQTYSYFNRGLYYKQLNRWLEYFSREQFLILKSEEFYQNPIQELSKIYNFLGIQQVFPENLTPKMIGKYNSKLNPETIKLLETAYMEDNDKLVELLGENFRWIKNTSEVDKSN